MKRHFIFISMVLLLSLAAGVFAQTPSPTPENTPPASPQDLNAIPSIAPEYKSDDRTLPDLGRVGVDMTRQRTLTLRAAIEMALENNKDITVSKQSVTMAEFELRAARGFFQPRFIGETYYDRTTTPNLSIFTSNQKTTQGSFIANTGLQAYVPQHGTVFNGFFNNSRATTNNPISVLSPQFNAALGFSFRQPLFRGREFDQPRRTIEVTRENIALTETQFRQRTIETVALVQKAYWDLAYALRNLQVQRDTVRDATTQLEHNRRLVAEGQLAPIDIVAAETQVANFEQSVYEALNIVSQTENVLKNLISPNRNDGVWGEALTPVDPVEIAVPRVAVGEAVETAIANRPELEINQSLKNINQLDQRLYRDQQKPQIDLIASYSSTGVGGSQNRSFDPNFPTPCTTTPNSPECLQQLANLALLTGSPYSGLFANRYPTFRVGISFNLPLFGDKTASAQLGRSLVEADQIETQREQLEQGIQVEVRNALQAIRTAEARLRSAAIARENSVKQYESEQRKLDEGQSDVYTVLERQTALATARSNELRARTELNKAIAELDRTTGSTLKSNDIELK
jgi:HAE1 family hydrophobic/amphiphilic exporter-1